MDTVEVVEVDPLHAPDVRSTYVRRGRPRKVDRPHTANATSSSPYGTADGQYACYVEECEWRGKYRSERTKHMRACHPNWEKPPRHVLAQLSRADRGDVIREPEFPCFIEGCPWKGHYRASRSVHMKRDHPDWQPPAKPKTAPADVGYQENGQYACHVKECHWRGASRGTRALHMKKAHESFVNQAYSPRNVPCCDCGCVLSSHKLFVEHMVKNHGMEGIVSREFATLADYEAWFEAVQDSFSIDFVKRMGVKTTPQCKVLYLYCARGGGYKERAALELMKKPPRRPPTRGTQKCGQNCAAYLRVVQWTDGQIGVVGCVEHTAHRCGTPLLRPNRPERDVMSEYLYSMEGHTPLEVLVDRLRLSDGYAIEGYEFTPIPRAELFKPVAEDAEIALLMAFVNDLPEGSVFNFQTPDNSLGRNLSFGFMTDEMRAMWQSEGNRALVIDEFREAIDAHDDVTYMVRTASVVDEHGFPHVVALWVSTSSSDRAPLLKQLHLAAPDVKPSTLVAPRDVGLWLDAWNSEMDQEIPADVQISEWQLLYAWASAIDLHHENRIDKFIMLCALRRYLRQTEEEVGQQLLNEFYEALREMELKDLACYFDAYFRDEGMMDRISPLAETRNPLTNHTNPTLDLALQELRSLFLQSTRVKRVDQWLSVLVHGVKSFNACQQPSIIMTRDVENDWQGEGMEEIDVEGVHPHYPMLKQATSRWMNEEEEEEDMFDDDTAYMTEEEIVVMGHAEDETAAAAEAGASGSLPDDQELLVVDDDDVQQRQRFDLRHAHLHAPSALGPSTSMSSTVHQQQQQQHNPFRPVTRASTSGSQQHGGRIQSARR